MDFSNIEKVRLKADGTYLLVKDANSDSFKLSHITINGDYSADVVHLRDRRGIGQSFFIEDVRKTDRIRWESPPIGYMNMPQKGACSVITRPPARTSKLGIRPELVRIDLLSKKKSVSFLDINQDDYQSLLTKKYPTYPEVAALLKKEDYESVALSRSAACSNVLQDVVSIEIGGVSCAWMWKDKVRVLNGLSPDFILKTSGVNILELNKEILRV